MPRYTFPVSSQFPDPAVRGSSLRRSIVRLLLSSLLTFAVILSGCGGGDGASQRAPHAGDGGRGRPSQPPVPIEVATAATGSIASYYTATATLEAEKEAEILARVTGEIEALECEEGDQVREGQVLLRIDNDEYRLRVAQAEANAASLRDRYNRLKEMWDQKLVSAEEYQNGLNELTSAEAEENLARLNLSYTRVTAPFTGRIVRRLVDVGQNVSNGTALFSIADFDPLLARVHVPSKEFKKLKPNQPVELVLDSNATPLQGIIKLVSPIIDPASGTIKLTIEIPQYPPQTRPGDFTEVKIVTELRTGTLLVPKIAVFTDRGETIAYVAADSTAERRIIEAGFEDDEHTEILSGIAEGEAVIVKGQRSLKHGAPIKIMNAEADSSAHASASPGEHPAGRTRPGRKGSK